MFTGKKLELDKGDPAWDFTHANLCVNLISLMSLLLKQKFLIFLKLLLANSYVLQTILKHFWTFFSLKKQKGKRTHGHRQQCGVCWVEGSIRGLNGNGKKIQ